jgi:hypothetical protein
MDWGMAMELHGTSIEPWFGIKTRQKILIFLPASHSHNLLEDETSIGQGKRANKEENCSFWVGGK